MGDDGKDGRFQGLRALPGVLSVGPAFSWTLSFAVDFIWLGLAVTFCRRALLPEPTQR